MIKLLQLATWGSILLAAASAAFGGDAPLADAVELQDLHRAAQLLAEGADVNQAQVDGMTALHWAVYHEDVKLATKLVKAGADVARENRYGVRPLSIACTAGNERLVELLLAAGADPNTTLRGGETALMTAARTGRPGPVKALLARGAKVDAKEQSGQTALMWAAAEGHATVVQLLIDAGADFRTPLASGFTPMLFAVREGHRDVVQILLRAGADVNQPMEVKRRPSAKYAANGTTPLILATENGHFELAIDLLKAGADPNDQRGGFAPLHVLTWVRKPNRGDGPDGDPPPQGSGQLGSLDFARQLVAYGADVNLRLKRGNSGRGVLSRRGATPFLLAADTADVPLMRVLLELGADPNIPNADHCPPLLAAAGIGTLAPGEEAGTESEAVEAVKLLLELGADVNVVDDNGETAMHGAAYASMPAVVKLLASRGAKPALCLQKNKYGWTPLTIAAGYRVGNFKPSVETLAALHDVLRASGIEPPATVRPAGAGAEY